VQNHVIWKVIDDTIKINEERVKLFIQNELGFVERVLRMYSKIWQYLDNKKMLIKFRNKFLDCYVRSIRGMTQDALDGSRLRWDACRKKLRDEDPYYFMNFLQALFRVFKNVECIRRCGTGWIRLRFRFPLIWIHTYQY